MSDLVPHIAYPIRCRGGRVATVEQGSREHALQCAEVVLRTPADTFEHDPGLGLADLVGSVGPIGPQVLAQLERHVPERGLIADEDLAALATRVRRVRIDVDDSEGT